MPTALYISPFFPPLARVGALAPLKLVRALDRRGWRSVVLSDLWAGAATDLRLLDAIPGGTVVCRDFSRRAKPAEARLLAAGRGPAPPSETGRARGRRRVRAPAWIAGREWLPLGEMGLNIPHAVAAARRLAARHAVDAVIAHATPAASLVVGEIVAGRLGLPLVAVLGDPWMPCALRAPTRPPHTALIEGWCERRVVRRAASMVLYTEAARDAYRARYDGLGGARFARIHHGCDPDLIGADAGPGFDRFTLLFLGTFSRFVTPRPFLALLAELRRRGVDGDRLAFAPTGGLDAEAEAEARALGVADMVRPAPRVSYRAVAATVAAADVLLMASPTPQRIQAKFYDYVAGERPILAVSDHHPELDALLAATGAGVRLGGERVGAMADLVEALLAAGRHPVRPRDPEALAALHVDASGRRLAALLAEAAGLPS